MNCSYEVDEVIKGRIVPLNCPNRATHLLSIKFKDDAGHAKKETFGYCDDHWSLVKSHYRNMEVREVE